MTSAGVPNCYTELTGTVTRRVSEGTFENVFWSFVHASIYRKD